MTGRGGRGLARLARQNLTCGPLAGSGSPVVSGGQIAPRAPLASRAPPPLTSPTGPVYLEATMTMHSEDWARALAPVVGEIVKAVLGFLFDTDEGREELRRAAADRPDLDLLRPGD